MDDRRQPPRTSEGSLPEGSTGGLLDEVPWDYDPEAQDPSPLVPTQRYFRDFPWEPEDVFEPATDDGGEAPAEPE